jgi:hypothetical protein
MNPPLAFISYDSNLSEAERVRFVDEAGSCSEKFIVDAWSMKRTSVREEWDKVIRGKIGRCDFMIVLVANNMDRRAIEDEIVQAKRSNVPFFGVLVGDADATTELPEGLPTNRTITCDWERIASAVSQVSKEGKHHVFA